MEGLPSLSEGDGGEGGLAALSSAGERRRAEVPPALNRNYTFDRFVVGKSNEFAHAAAQGVARQPGQLYNPLVMYSDVGLGKTHLMHAIGHQVAARGMSLIYSTTEEFTNSFIRAIRDGTTDEFRDYYRSADVLLLDDVQFLIGKDQTQEGFFHTFNALHQTNRQIVVTSDRPVSALALLEDRIQSRLAGGLVVDIQPPDIETRIAILRAKADGAAAASDLRRRAALPCRAHPQEHPRARRRPEQGDRVRRPDGDAGDRRPRQERTGRRGRDRRGATDTGLSGGRHRRLVLRCGRRDAQGPQARQEDRQGATGDDVPAARGVAAWPGHDRRGAGRQGPHHRQARVRQDHQPAQRGRSLRRDVINIREMLAAS